MEAFYGMDLKRPTRYYNSTKCMCGTFPLYSGEKKEMRKKQKKREEKKEKKIPSLYLVSSTQQH